MNSNVNKLASIDTAILQQKHVVFLSFYWSGANWPLTLPSLFSRTWILGLTDI